MGRRPLTGFGAPTRPPNASLSAGARVAAVVAAMALSFGPGTAWAATAGDDASPTQPETRTAVMALQGGTTGGSGGGGSGGGGSGASGSGGSGSVGSGSGGRTGMEPPPPANGGNMNGSGGGMSGSGGRSGGRSGGSGSSGSSGSTVAACKAGYTLMTVRTMLRTVAGATSGALRASDRNGDGRLCVQLIDGGQRMRKFVDNKLP